MKQQQLAVWVAGAVLAMSSPAFADTVVKIGFASPMSGPQAHYGKDNENATRMAIDDLNAKPITVAGQKVKFELVSEDDQADPRVGTQVAQQLGAVSSQVTEQLGTVATRFETGAARIAEQGQAALAAQAEALARQREAAVQQLADTQAAAQQAEQLRSSETGVSLDEEAARLIQYQQSYQAAAKVLQVAQSLFDTLLQTTGR